MLFTVAFWFIKNPSTDLEPSLGILVTLGVVMHALLPMVVFARMVAATEQEALVMSFRTALFIGFGLTEIPVLSAILLTFFGAAYPVILVGAAVTLTGMWRIAPSQRVFRMCDERLQAQGKAIRMTEAWRRLLTDPPPTMPPPRPDA